MNKTPKPPKKIKHVELWLNDITGQPRIVYPDGSADIFLNEEWFRSSMYGWDDCFRNSLTLFTFIAELK